MTGHRPAPRETVAIQDMIRRGFIPLISFLAAVLVFTGWTLSLAFPVNAQNAAAPQNSQPAKPAPSGDVNERIGRLEQRILDLQGVIGTLQTFVKNGASTPVPGGLPPGGGPPGGSGGAPSEVNIRVLALETQIRALTAQMEQISGKLNQMAATPGAVAQPLQAGQQLGGAPQQVPQAQVPGGGAQFGQPERPTPQFGTTTAAPVPANPFDQAMRAPQPRPGTTDPTRTTSKGAIASLDRPSRKWWRRARHL